MPNQDPNQQRNFILAMVLMVGFVFAYQQFVIEPGVKARRAAAAAAEAANPTPVIPDTVIANTPVIAATVEEALAANDRVMIDGNKVDGSLNLTGARIDDLNLKNHYQTVEKIDELRLLRPQNVANGYYATYNWLDAGGGAITQRDATWELIDGSTLTSESNVTLRLVSSGIEITRVIDLDADYMFTITDTLRNVGATPRSVVPYGSLRRHGQFNDFLDATDPGSAGTNMIAHTGLTRAIGNNMTIRSYKNLSKGKGIKGDTESIGEGGWIAMTDKYWMTTLIPDQSSTFEVDFALRNEQMKKIAAQKGVDNPVYEMTTTGEPIAIPAGGSITSQNRIFAGAKEFDALKAYSASTDKGGLGLDRLDDAIDWGSYFYFLTKPFFIALSWLEGLLGGFGLAILAFTVLVKIPLFPLYNKSYKSMAKMKLLSEPMKRINEQFKDDPKRKQQEIMELYKREKANPIAGCLPILATIPIFYALYKTLFVTLEMRHAPFLYMKDLSAPDPLAIGNLFGAIPWMGAGDIKTIPILGIILGIGLLPVLYGITMTAIQSLNPPPPDKTQATIMMALPIVFTFVFAGFSAGLVLYWVWSNMLSLVQQYVIMRRNGVETQLDKLINRLRGKPSKEAS